MNILQAASKVYSDARGEIIAVADETLFIRSVKGALRANHYHKSTGHTCLMTKGRLFYYERPVGSTEKPVKFEIGINQPFYTGPMLEHCMEFLDDENEMVCVSYGKRDQSSYENDLVRLDFDLSKV